MAKLESDMQAGANYVGGTWTEGAALTTMTATAPWETVRYGGISHAFSNWHSEGYDGRADARSWRSLATFLGLEFGSGGEDGSIIDPPPLEVRVAAVTYVDGMDGDRPLEGYVSVPEEGAAGGGSSADAALLPAVIILPHDARSTVYETQRATRIADDGGYIAFAAGLGHADDGGEEIMASDVVLSRIRAAISHVKDMDGVDPTNIALIGFGLGGTGALYYAMLDDVDVGVKAIASFHGDLDLVANATAAADNPADDYATGGDDGGFAWDGQGGGSGGDLPDASWDAAPTGTRRRTNVYGGNSSVGPRILIQSGVDGDDMDVVLAVERALVAMEADHEITRFSDAGGDFTVWNSSSYNERASARSMDQLNTVLLEVFARDPTPSPSAGPIVESSGTAAEPTPVAVPTPTPAAGLFNGNSSSSDTPTTPAMVPAIESSSASMVESSVITSVAFATFTIWTLLMF
jgi:hypothetical protein